MSLKIVDQSVIGLINTTTRVSITIEDSTNTLVDPYSLKLTVMDLGGTTKLSDTWTSSTPGARITKTSTGKFYVDFGNQTPNTETDSPSEWLFNWQIQLVNGGKVTNSMQKLRIISARTASFMPELKLVIDKSRKLIDSAQDCFLGYSDSQLLAYLEGGLGTINAYQPYGAFNLDNFPLEYKQILVDAALITGVMSQQLYAIDTDIPNYNDQGTSFVISHQPQLAGVLNQITQRLDKLIPMMKLHMLQSGSVHVQMGPNYRMSQLMSAGPNGAIFRGVFFKG